jgi:hypothetical protein
LIRIRKKSFQIPAVMKPNLKYRLGRLHRPYLKYRLHRPYLKYRLHRPYLKYRLHRPYLKYWLGRLHRPYLKYRLYLLQGLAGLHWLAGQPEKSVLSILLPRKYLVRILSMPPPPPQCCGSGFKSSGWIRIRYPDPGSEIEL